MIYVTYSGSFQRYLMYFFFSLIPTLHQKIASIAERKRYALFLFDSIQKRDISDVDTLNAALKGFFTQTDMT